jgi:hypothetical protein
MVPIPAATFRVMTDKVEDGGASISIKVNNNTVCESMAAYGGASATLGMGGGMSGGHSHGDSKGSSDKDKGKEKWETISEMSEYPSNHMGGMKD